MLTIFAIMATAVVLGWLLRHRAIPGKALSRVISIVVLLMMMLIGVEMGTSPSVVTALGGIVTDAALLCLGSVCGTIAMAWLVNRYILKSKNDKHGSRVNSSNHTFSLLIVSVFILGVLLGYNSLLPFVGAETSMWALYLLMALVGFSIGSDTASLRAIASQPLRVIFVPLATIIGTYIGVLMISPLISLKLTDCMAVGSGFGYYSLSSVLLSELRTVQIGAIALLVNVLRELFTVVFAPVLVRHFSALSLICCGGATTMDVTLPIIINYCGGSFIGVAIFHGIIVDLCVPFLVTLFASI